MLVNIEQSDEILVTPSGLSIVGRIIGLTSLNSRLNNVVNPLCPEPKILNSDVVFSYLGLLCQGKIHFDNIEEFRNSDFYKLALNISTVPSSPTLRQRFQLTGEEFYNIIKEENVALLKAVEVILTPCFEDYIPLDIDVSPFDNSNSKKDGVSRTYKGYDGFAPIFAYLGEEGYCINTELREGKTHCQKGTINFLAATLQYAHSITNQPILVRLDSGNDCKDNMITCYNSEGQTDFIIKRNLRKEDPIDWYEIAVEKGSCETTRKGKKVYTGSIEREVMGIEKPVRIVFQVTERTISDEGQYLLFPEIEVETYWTSLSIDEKVIIELYHQHGTSEQFHSELKTDMGIEKLPAGEFAVNHLILILAMLAYNILRLIGQESLKLPDAPIRHGVFRRRIKTVIQNIITIASKLTYSGRKYKLRFGSQCSWFKTFKRVHSAFG